MIKLIASDLDKTLMQRTESRLSPTVENDIKAALNRGVQFAVISGRDYPSLRKVFASVADRIYFVGCCGALCVKDGKLLSTSTVDDVWTKMWIQNYGEITLTNMPQEAGEYSVELYFDSLFVHEQTFTIS